MAKILNNILCIVMTFLLTFAWTVYCIKNARVAFWLALIVALCFGYIVFAALSKLQKNKYRKRTEQKKLKDFFAFLQFNKDNQVLFAPMLTFYRYEVSRIDFDSAIMTKDERELCVFLFQSDSVNIGQIQNAVVCAKRNDCSKLTVFCNKADNTLQAVASSQIPSHFVDIANTYALFEQAEKLPEFCHTNMPKQHIIPQYMFNKKRFGWYFAGAVFTLITASISFLKAYLLVWATILFGCALYCLFNKKYNKIPTNVKLE